MGSDGFFNTCIWGLLLPAKCLGLPSPSGLFSWQMKVIAVSETRDDAECIARVKLERAVVRASRSAGILVRDAPSFCAEKEAVRTLLKHIEEHRCGPTSQAWKH